MKEGFGKEGRMKPKLSMDIETRASVAFIAEVRMVKWGLLCVNRVRGGG